MIEKIKIHGVISWAKPHVWATKNITFELLSVWGFLSLQGKPHTKHKWRHFRADFVPPGFLHTSFMDTKEWAQLGPFIIIGNWWILYVFEHNDGGPLFASPKMLTTVTHVNTKRNPIENFSNRHKNYQSQKNNEKCLTKFWT